MSVVDEAAATAAELDRLTAAVQGELGWESADRLGRRTASVYRVDPARMAKAVELSNVQGTVRVYIRRMAVSHGQIHSTLEHGPPWGTALTHGITLNTRLSVWRADRTIFHELRHARQCEERGGPEEFDQAYDRCIYDMGLTKKSVRSNDYDIERFYRLHPFEADARAAETLAIFHQVCELRRG